ncbi:MAG: F0F1 ATP synthase subunit A [Anaerolineaceae bacterium]|nr:F0F1 ATP synthase subunit A [Anaerolineaceae bacterium]
MGEPSEVVIPLFGFLDVTGEVITMWIIIAILAVLSIYLGKRLQERPGKLQNVIETGIEYLDNTFSANLGHQRARKYFWFMGSLFIFIIFANYSGLIPGVGLTKYLKAPTSSLSVTAGLGVCTFCFLQAASIRAKGIKGYIKHFISPIIVMLPLLALDEIIKPVSLSLRLFGNIFGEEAVLEKFYEILPIGAPLVMMALSLLFCALQAVVYTTLVSIYLDEATETNEE